MEKKWSLREKVITNAPRHSTENQKFAVFAFGRLNPPTIGHKKLVDKIKSIPGYFLFFKSTQKPNRS